MIPCLCSYWPNAISCSQVMEKEKHGCNSSAGLQGWSRPGVCGLDNSGNSCYLNAVLQCLCSTVPLVEHLLNKDTLKELTRYDHNISLSDSKTVNFFPALKLCMHEGQSVAWPRCLFAFWRRCGWDGDPAVHPWRPGPCCAPSSLNLTTILSKTPKNCSSLSSMPCTTTSRRCSALYYHYVLSVINHSN